VAAAGAAGFLVLAAAYAIGALASPAALISGLHHPLDAALALGAPIAATALLAVRNPGPARVSLAAAAALGTLYLASIELITAVPGLAGQALLSGMWALAGVAALLAGLLADDAPLRHGALALLTLTTAKVFLYDLASLSEIYRVASFIALGLLLLGGAFAWQRVRPCALPDLRAMPEGLR
jgi:hypothetical protein